MRREEGIAIEFLMQVDVPAYRIPGFVERASEAGCCSVFIGMESLNPRNLADTGKLQNNTEEYGPAIRAWRKARVRAQVGYIIGLPHDTGKSVREDVERLIREVQPGPGEFLHDDPAAGLGGSPAVSRGRGGGSTGTITSTTRATKRCRMRS